MVIHSSFQFSYLWLPIIGLITGLIATMIGSNGGSVFPPILILIFNIPPQIAIATSLAAAIPIGLVGTISHQYKGNIQLKTGIVFIITGFFGAIIGAYITRFLSAELLRIVLGVYMIILGIFFLVSTAVLKKESATSENYTATSGSRRVFTGSSYGFLAGSATGLFGISGMAPVLAGMLSLKLPVKMIAGTSLMIVFLNTLSGFTGHILAGQIDMTLVLLLASGSVTGSIAGPIILGSLKFDKIDTLIQKPNPGIKYALTAVFIIFGFLLML